MGTEYTTNRQSMSVATMFPWLSQRIQLPVVMPSPSQVIRSMTVSKLALGLVVFVSLHFRGHASGWCW
jgi:hypothetical protein